MGTLISVFPNPWIVRSGSCYFYSIAKALNSRCLSSSYNFLYSSSAFVPLKFIFIPQLEDLFSHLYLGVFLTSWLSFAIWCLLAFLEARFCWIQGNLPVSFLPPTHLPVSQWGINLLTYVLCPCPSSRTNLSFLCLSNFMPFKTQVLLGF